MSSLPRVTCPECGYHNGLEVFAGERFTREAMALVGQIPPVLIDNVWRYLRLFALPTKKMTWPAAVEQLQPLVTAITTGEVVHKGRPWRVTLQQIGDALRFVLERHRQGQLTLPLKTHGYLWTVVAGAADTVEAAHEQRLEEDRRHGIAAPTPVPPPSRSPVVDDEPVPRPPVTAWTPDPEPDAAIETRRATQIAVGELCASAKFKTPLTAEALKKKLGDMGISLPVATQVTDKVMSRQKPADDAAS